MKGIIFNLLEAVVCQHFGEETWEELLEAAGTDGTFTSLGSYPDEELMRLVAAAANKLSLSTTEVVRWAGIQALPLMAERYQQFFQGHSSTRSFLLTLNNVIHPEVLKLYPGADTPIFHYDTSSPDYLVMEYKSRRRMCAFAEGLILGAASYFGEDARIEHTKCIDREEGQCIFYLTFEEKAGAAHG